MKAKNYHKRGNLGAKKSHSRWFIYLFICIGFDLRCDPSTLQQRKNIFYFSSSLFGVKLNYYVEEKVHKTLNSLYIFSTIINTCWILVNSEAGTDGSPLGGQVQHHREEDRRQLSAPRDPGSCRSGHISSIWTLLLETTGAVHRFHGKSTGFVYFIVFFIFLLLFLHIHIYRN